VAAGETRWTPDPVRLPARQLWKTLGVLSAVIGIVFLLPYLQLRITGLELLIRVATGGAVNGTISSAIAFLLVIAFVLWSGLHGVARTSYFKDSLMIIVMLVITIAVPMHLNGGLDFGLSTIARDMPRLLYVQPGSYGIWWFITSMAISTIGTIFYSSPMRWPAVMASRNERAVRRNLIYLPIYSALASIARPPRWSLPLPCSTASHRWPSTTSS
jgi:SSS family solute:Na+ symporter